MECSSQLSYCLLFFFFPQQAQCGLDLRHITVVELVGVFPTLIGRIGAKIMPPALALQLRYGEVLSLNVNTYKCTFSLIKLPIFYSALMPGNLQHLITFILGVS